MNYEPLESATRYYRIDQDGWQYIVRWRITDTDGTVKFAKVFWSPSAAKTREYVFRRLERMGAVRLEP